MTSLAWSEAFSELRDVVPLPLPGPVREWAWGRATGAGVKVAIVDSGVDATHPRVGGVQGYVALEIDDSATDGIRYDPDPHEDLVGHGTACAAIIRSLAPEVEIYSVRVLGSNLKGKGAVFLAGIEWAIAQGMDVVNLSLSSRSPAWFGPLHEASDLAYFSNTLLVCAANNYPGPTYPSQFASVLSVAARAGSDPWALAYNPDPPVEFAARGIDVDVAWSGGGSTVATGNSFAAPHVAGMSALIRSKHPGLNAFQVKSVLHAVADNALPGSSAR
jgi:subtilisin